MSRAAAAGLLCVVWACVGGCDRSPDDPEYSASTPYTGQPANDQPGSFRVRRDTGTRPDAGAMDAAVDAAVDATVDAAVDAAIDAALPDMEADADLTTCGDNGDCVFAVDLDACSACPTVMTTAQIEAGRCLVRYNAQVPFEAYEPLDCGGNCRVTVDQFCARPLGLAECNDDGQCFERRVDR